MSIPRLIHYVWVGGKEKPELIQKCIKSWQKLRKLHHKRVERE